MVGLGSAWRKRRERGGGAEGCRPRSQSPAFWARSFAQLRPGRRERKRCLHEGGSQRGGLLLDARGRRKTSDSREHFLIERELANRLRNAPKHQRATLYGELYDELFRRVPRHPQLTRRLTPALQERAIAQQFRLLKPFLRRDVTFLEIGAGDCAMSIALSKRVRKVYAVDVTSVVSGVSALPGNVEFALSDGTSVPVPPSRIHVAYSHQLMEHLHPQDALEQVRNIYRALTPGGQYLCVTPNRLSGPHDVSRDFSDVATGFHLKEYTVGELRLLFEAAGFLRIDALVGGRGYCIRSPPAPIEFLERLLSLAPRSAARFLARRRICTAVIGAQILATK